MGFIERRLMKNVAIVDLLRRSLTVSPRIFLLLLPVLAPIFLAVAWLTVQVGFAGGGTSSGRAEQATGLVYGAMALLGSILAPVITVAISRVAIRSAFGERARYPVLLDGVRQAGLGAFAIGAAFGVIQLLAFAACYIPGLVVTGFFMPIAAVAAIEHKSFGRALELTNGTRLTLVGVAFLQRFFVGFAFYFTSVVAPRNLYRHEDSSHLWLYTLLVTAAAAFAAVWEASLGAIAYNDLRIRTENLEIDAVAAELGGKAVIGIDRDDLAVSERGLEMRAKARRATAILIGVVVALGAIGAVAYPIMSERWEREEQEAKIREMIEREDAARRARPPSDVTTSRLGMEEDEPAPRPRRPRSAPDLTDLDEPPPPPVPTVSAEPEKTVEEIVAALKSKDEAVRFAALTQDVPKHSDDLWGVGLKPVFAQLKKVAEDKRELAVIPILAQGLHSYQCGDALNKAREAAPEEASETFAKLCPAEKEKRALKPANWKKVPLWAGALAMTMQLRATDFEKQKEPLHVATIAALQKLR